MNYYFTLAIFIGLAIIASSEDLRLLDLSPEEAQQHIESKDQTLKYAPKIESNVPAVRVLGKTPTNVLEDTYLANQYHGQDGLGGYLYGYSVPDIAKTEKKKAGGDLKGAYQYINDAGQEIKVQYWDDGTGFHQIDNLPEVLPKQVEDSPDVQAAKNEFFKRWHEEAERNSKPVSAEDGQQQYQQGQYGSQAGPGAHGSHQINTGYSSAYPHQSSGAHLGQNQYPTGHTQSSQDHYASNQGQPGQNYYQTPQKQPDQYNYQSQESKYQPTQIQPNSNQYPSGHGQSSPGKSPYNTGYSQPGSYGSEQPQYQSGQTSLSQNNPSQSYPGSSQPSQYGQAQTQSGQCPRCPNAIQSSSDSNQYKSGPGSSLPGNNQYNTGYSQPGQYGSGQAPYSSGQSQTYPSQGHSDSIQYPTGHSQSYPGQNQYSTGYNQPSPHGSGQTQYQSGQSPLTQTNPSQSYSGSKPYQTGQGQSYPGQNQYNTEESQPGQYGSGQAQYQSGQGPVSQTNPSQSSYHSSQNKPGQNLYQNGYGQGQSGGDQQFPHQGSGNPFDTGYNKGQGSDQNKLYQPNPDYSHQSSTNKSPYQNRLDQSSQYLPSKESVSGQSGYNQPSQTGSYSGQSGCAGQSQQCQFSQDHQNQKAPGYVGQGSYQPGQSSTTYGHGQGGDYSGQPSNQQTWTQGQGSAEWEWKPTEEEKGPPKGFFYNVDYPVGIIVQKPGAAGGVHKRESLEHLYSQNKENFYQQLKNGGSGTGLPQESYQVHA